MTSPGGRGELIGVIWFTLLFLAAMGIANGNANQNAYLLPGLRMADPSFLPGDWYTGEVTHSHRAFSLLVAAAVRSVGIVPGLTLLAILQNALFALAAYGLVRGFRERPLMAWAAALAWFAAIDTQCLGSSRWLMPYAEPSSLAAVAFTGALAFLLHGRQLATGATLGLAALFHEHFVILSLPILVVASYCIFRNTMPTQRPRQWILLWLAYLLIASPSFYLIASFASSPGTEEIRWLTGSLFPYHLLPAHWKSYFFLLFAAGMAFGLGGVLLRRPQRAFDLVLLAAMLLLVVGASVALAFFPAFEMLTHIWPWRLSAPLLFLTFAAGAAALANPQPKNAASPRWTAAAYALLAGGLAVLWWNSYSPSTQTLLLLAALPVVSWLATRSRTLERGQAGAAVVVVSLAFVFPAVRAIGFSHLDFSPDTRERSKLYEWIQEATPEEAIFSIPPSWQDFRLNARRPIVVDWKSIPRYPPDRIRWLERMRDTSRVERPGSDLDELDRGYAAMDCDRAGAIQDGYGARYFVHERDVELGCGAVVYEDGRFRVWDLGAN